MDRTTVDFGIDLGTTKSAIAVLQGREIKIIKNNEGQEYTPSAVFINRDNALVVGSRANNRLESDPENAFAEFKLQMGTDAEYVFARNGRRMKPEQLSAEVLKSLKSDVRQHLGEEVRAAVITVPAAFELPQCYATKKAAELAGIDFSLLVTEPAAAAFAYGFQNEKSNSFWVVYDFGSGAFDAAVIKVHDGIIQVVNHEGDRYLGGKLIDWAIVEHLLIPALTHEHRLTDFRRGNPRYRKAIAKLKQAAEQAKITVSHFASAKISIDALAENNEGKTIDFEFDLKKREVERISQPFIRRSVDICRRMLADRRLNIGDVERVLLVGGTTLMPYLREFLADSKTGLGIPLEFSIDPLSAVVRGAARFAGTQRNELENATGAGRDTVSDNTSYTVGLDSVLPHSVGLALANNEVRVVFEKGTLLPARKRFITKLAYPIRKSEDGQAIRLPVIEGEHKRADRNNLIGYLEIPDTKIERDLPTGAEIEITIMIDQSRLVSAEAYIPLINTEFEKVLTMKKPTPNLTELKEELEREKGRLEEAREKLYAVNDAKAMLILARIEEEQILEDVESSLDATAVDRDAVDKAQNCLLKLKATMDELEDALEIPTLLAEATQMIEWTEEVVNKWGKPTDHSKFTILLAELKVAMETDVLNRSDLNRRIEYLDELRMKIVMSRDEWWLGCLSHLEERKQEMTNQTLAEQLFRQARRSINDNDIDGLKSVCYRLTQLIPLHQKQNHRNYSSAISGTSYGARERCRSDFSTGGAAADELSRLSISRVLESGASELLVGREQSELLLQAEEAAKRQDWQTAIDYLRKGLEGSNSSDRETLQKYLSLCLANQATVKVSHSIESIRDSLATPALIDSVLTELKSAELQLTEATVLNPSSDVANRLSEIRSFLSLLVREPVSPRAEPSLPQAARQGTPEVPCDAVNQVHFSITSPRTVLRKSKFVLIVWAHLEEQRIEVITRAREFAGGNEIQIQSKGPTQVPRGAILTVRLKIEGLIVEDPEDTILWEGQVGNATFNVTIPSNVTTGEKQGIAMIHIDGLRIAKLHFTIRVGRRSRLSSRTTKTETLSMREERHRKAFASYASDDRDDVLARIQGIQKAAPELDIFLDVLSLRSGENWEQRLWGEIPANDIFYLFWSKNASKSKWVEKEWHCALKTKGLDFIDPVPLVSPDEVPPPPELASKHFNDWVLAFMRVRGSRG